MLRRLVLITALLLTALAASAAPLLVYTTSLALFGLPHVLAELRYVDHRFAGRWANGRGTGLIFLLGALVIVRVLGLGDAFGPGIQPVIELTLLGASVALVLPALVAAGPVRGGLGLLALGLLLVGVLRAPLATLVLLAFLHNLTPVGFLAEKLRGAARRRALAWCALGFGVLPLLIIGGAFAWLIGGFGMARPDLSVLSVGTLGDHLGVFVPRSLGDGALASQWFAAAAFLQCLHYAVVLHVLPRLIEDTDSGAPTVIPWPSPRTMAALLVLAGATFALGFAFDFRGTRSIYGVFAAVHAWVEIPLLLAALGAVPGARSARPRPA